MRQYCVILNGLTVAAVLVLCDGHASWDGLLSILSLVKTQVSGSVPQFCFLPSDKEVPKCEFVNQSMGSLSH